MIGLPPVLISFTTFVFKPMADIASTIRNLLSSFIGVKNDEPIPKCIHTVVMIDAAIKYKMNQHLLKLISCLEYALLYAVHKI